MFKLCDGGVDHGREREREGMGRFRHGLVGGLLERGGGKRSCVCEVRR